MDVFAYLSDVETSVILLTSDMWHFDLGARH